MSLKEEDVAAIRAAIEKDADAVRRSDWAAVAEMFTVDAVRFPPGVCFASKPMARGCGRRT